jgi:nucleoside-diphosphate-sugar epimerase
MPTNLYGPEDNFHPTHSHVIPALIGKFHHAVSHHLPQVEIWGTGQARREFLHVDDMAEACIFVMDLDEQVYQQQTQPMCSHLNIGTGQDIRIQELADMLADISGFTGEIVYNHDKPDGAPRKLLNTAKINQLGWRAKIDLYTGLKQTYQWFACSHWANTSAI